MPPLATWLLVSALVCGAHSTLVAVKDDPHFTGKHGVQFDFHGQLNKSFCLITDANLQVNALLRGYRDNRSLGASAPDADGYKIRSWIKAVAILWREPTNESHVLLLVSRDGAQAARGQGYLAQVELDGEELDKAGIYNGTKVEEAGLSFFFTGVVPRDGELLDSFQVYVSGLLDASIVMRPASKQLQTKEDAEVHFNVNFKYIHATKSIHGVLGQSYRDTDEQIAKAVKYSLVNKWLGKPVQADDDTGEDKDFLDGVVADYITSNVTSPDCKYSAF